MRLLRLRTILAATDLTATSDAALVSASALAGAAGATLHIVHVTPRVAENIAATGRRSEYEYELAQSLRRLGIDADGKHVHIVEGDTPSAISALAERTPVDVIVLGRQLEGKLPATRPVGGTAYAVIVQATVPCLCVTQPMPMPMTRVLVGLDYSQTARGALLTALSWASGLRPTQATDDSPTLTALHVDTGQASASENARSQPSVEHEVDVFRRNAAGWANIAVRAETVTADNAATAIAQFARNGKSQLVVLGTRGLSPGQEYGMGSVSAAVLSRLTIPVLLVPPAVWRNHAKEIDYL